MLLATEYAPPSKRGFYGSFAQVGVPVGLVLGNAFFLILAAVQSQEAFGAWGWRIPFIASILLIGLAMYIQLRLEDTPAFRRLQERQQQAQEEEGGEAQQRSPVLQVIREHPKQILLASGAFFVVNGAFYVMITGMLDYGTRDLGLSRSAMLTAVLISSFAQIFMLPAWSALSDRVGRRPVYLSGAVLLGLWSFPLFWLVDTRNIVLITVALLLGQLFLSMMYGPQAALFSEMFSRQVRYSGASIGYQLAAVFAGGLAPIIMVWLLDTTGTSISVSIYMFAMAALTFFSVYLVTETYEDEMAEDVAEEEGAAAKG
jgi:MFS family permease